MFNNVTLIGYLGSDAESRRTRKQLDPGGPFARDKADLEKPRNGRTRIADDMAQMCRLRAHSRIFRHLEKGAHVQIVGEIQTRDYVAKDGAKKSVTEIRVHRIARLDRATKTESAQEAAA